MGHLAYGITAFLISKLMFIEHNVTDTKKKKKSIKLPFALKKTHFQLIRKTSTQIAIPFYNLAHI